MNISPSTSSQPTKSPLGSTPVISSANAQLNLKEVIDDIFMVLSPKEQDVVAKRFQLKNNSKQTLEEIGRHFNVTRERIRQIEKVALAKLRRNADKTKLRIINDLGKEILINRGGIMLEENVVNEVLANIHSISKIDADIVRLSLTIDNEIIRQDRTFLFKPYRRMNSILEKDVSDIVNRVFGVLTKNADVMPEKKLVNEVQVYFADRGRIFKPETIQSILTIDQRLKKTDDDNWGLLEWRHINPRSIRDKSFIVLRDAKEPMHFVEMANAITERGFDKKTVTVQAVHNELIRDEKFVLIGRGIYALKSWGYEEGTVADIIEKILAKKSPLSKADIIRSVLKQRQVKKGTISLNLQKTPWFARVGRAMYKLDLSKKKNVKSRKKQI